MKNIYKDQSGASAIMFTMFFIIVISLITIGFATLARRDERAALDKTLSGQARYVAETGVNSVKDYIDKTPAPVSNANCDPTAVSGYTKPTFTSGLDIKCIKWDNNPTRASFTKSPYEAYSFNQKNFTGFTKLTWTTEGATNAYNNPTETMPSVGNNYKSIIKVVTVNKGDVYTTPSRVQVFYLVPTTGSGSNNVSLGCPGHGCVGANAPLIETANGKVYNIPCNDTECVVNNIDGYPCPSVGCGSFTTDYQDRLFYFMPIGSAEATTINYQSMAGGIAQPLVGIQTKVDVNVIAQDQSKRVVAYITKDHTDTWQPWFAALTDSLCKDIKVDGTNSTGVQGLACPNN